ncbi:APETALA1 and FRUITFULL like protein [Artemisia annua]|uniref:APETALA1 and FRUITFULL like protein n=1 Tax=Artemisia annua TaxID=35608 RepID=A0A2U1LZY2_ARTAN|nr:APETALA1 and FRUITFULL like protein [Artemisia annua]
MGYTQLQGRWTLEHAKLKCRFELLQKTKRHLKGEDLDSLTLKELQNLEHQIDTALKHIRLRKNQMMFESISVLQKKDKELQNQNNVLSKKVKEVEKDLAQQPLVEQQNPDNMLHLDTYTSTPCQVGGDGVVEKVPGQARPIIVLPPWMLQHMNE